MTKHRTAYNEVLIIQAQSAENEIQRRIYFNQLVQQYQGMAYGYAYAILGDVQLAEDAAQESFLTAYQLLFQLREPHAFPLWLQRIVHSHCCRMLKEQKRLSQSLELSTDLIAEQPSPQATLEQSELQEVVRAILESLPKSQQAPVTLYYLDNYSQLEIAKILKLSLAAVKKRLERARYHLEERMRGMAQEYLRSTAQGRGVTVELFTTFMEAAAAEGQYVLLETLLLEGMDVDDPDSNGQTILHWAAKEGHLEAVELLLNYRADSARRDHTGRTPLQLAVEGRHAEVAKRLRHDVSPV